MKQLKELQPAPSVGMHDVPRQSVGEHLGFGYDQEEGRDSLDASVARKFRENTCVASSILHFAFNKNTLDSFTTCKKLRHVPKILMTLMHTDGTQTTH